MNYKLTDEKGQTYGGCQWGKNVTHTATGNGNEMCSDGVIHYYEDALLAVFANPIHSGFEYPILWEFNHSKELGSDSMKSWCKTGTTLKQIPLPVITTGQRVEIAIRCSMVVYHESVWSSWANKWLSGEDRSAYAADANAAAYAANAADANAAAYAANAAAYAANAAAYAANAAAYAANAANADANAAAYAAYAAYAANAAAYAAYAAAAANAANADIIKIIHEVVERRELK